MHKPSSHRLLLIAVSVLTIFGLLMVYSASSVVASLKKGTSSYYVLRQVAYGVVGYLFMMLLMHLDYHLWQKRKVVKALTGFSLLSLMLVFTQPVIKGAHRWFRFGTLISFQPSEFAKLVLLIGIALFLHNNEEAVRRPRGPLLSCLMLVGLFTGLIGAEPDFGQALCLSLIVALLLFVAGLRWTYFAAAGFFFVPTLGLIVRYVPYLWVRAEAFLHPSRDPLGAGWQTLQAKIALGSGGFFGLGLGAGLQKLFFLPEPHGDFIFAVIGEEFGWIGTNLIAFAFLVYFFCGLKTAQRAPDRFGFYLSLGITLMVVLPAFVNMSMVLALLPTKGIALPFLSQGGSSLLLNLMATGVLLNISISAKEPEAEADSTSRI